MHRISPWYYIWRIRLYNKPFNFLHCLPSYFNLSYLVLKRSSFHPRHLFLRKGIILRGACLLFKQEMRFRESYNWSKSMDRWGYGSKGFTGYLRRWLRISTNNSERLFHSNKRSRFLYAFEKGAKNYGLNEGELIFIPRIIQGVLSGVQHYTWRKLWTLLMFLEVVYKKFQLSLDYSRNCIFQVLNGRIWNQTSL